MLTYIFFLINIVEVIKMTWAVLIERRRIPILVNSLYKGNRPIRFGT